MSLAFSLFVWVALIVALPNLGDYVASNVYTVEPPRIVETKAVALRNELRQKIMQYLNQNRPRGGVINGSQSITEGTYRFSIADLNWMNYLDIFIPYSEKLRLECADRIYSLWKEYIDKLVQQARRVDHFTLYSPVRLYNNIANILARTDVQSHVKFLDQARQYREQILRYFQNKDVYHQYRFSTVMERGEPFEVRGNLFDENSEDAKRWRTLNEKANFNTRPPLDLADFPRFRYQAESLGSSLSRALPNFAGLVFIVLGTLLLTYFCFVRYDVR
jgi:hypothetical protein